MWSGDASVVCDKSIWAGRSHRNVLPAPLTRTVTMAFHSPFLPSWLLARRPTQRPNSTSQTPTRSCQTMLTPAHTADLIGSLTWFPSAPSPVRPLSPLHPHWLPGRSRSHTLQPRPPASAWGAHAQISAGLSLTFFTDIATSKSVPKTSPSKQCPHCSASPQPALLPSLSSSLIIVLRTAFCCCVPVSPTRN